MSSNMTTLGGGRKVGPLLRRVCALVVTISIGGEKRSERACLSRPAQVVGGDKLYYFIYPFFILLF